MSKDLRNRFRKETKKEPIRLAYQTIPSVTTDYIKWLEEQLSIHVFSNSAYLCKNVNGEDAIIMAENIADVFDKLEDITPTPEFVEVSGKSTTVYH